MTLIEQLLNRERNSPQDNGHIDEQEVEEREIQSPSLPSEIKNVGPINLCVDMKCDTIDNEAAKKQNREENSMESKAIDNTNKDRSREIVQLFRNESRGRKKYRNFGDSTLYQKTLLNIEQTYVTSFKTLLKDKEESFFLLTEEAEPKKEKRENTQRRDLYLVKEEKSKTKCPSTFVNP